MHPYLTSCNASGRVGVSLWDLTTMGHPPPSEMPNLPRVFGALFARVAAELKMLPGQSRVSVEAVMSIIESADKNKLLSHSERANVWRAIIREHRHLVGWRRHMRQVGKYDASELAQAAASVARGWDSYE